MVYIKGVRHTPALMNFTKKEMRTKTLWRSAERPNHSIEMTHLIGARRDYLVYESSRVSELFVTTECIGSFRTLQDAIDFLTY